MFPFVDGTLLEVVGFTNKMSLNAGVCVGLRLLLELLVKMSNTQKTATTAITLHTLGVHVTLTDKMAEIDLATWFECLAHDNLTRV